MSFSSFKERITCLLEHTITQWEKKKTMEKEDNINRLTLDFKKSNKNETQQL